MSGWHHERDDVAAYVLGALGDDEAAAFAAHLTRCAECREDVERLRVAGDSLALAVPQYAAPDAVKRRVMTAVRGEAELFRAAELTPKRRRLAPRRLAFGRPAALLAGAAMLASGVVIGALGLDGGARAPSRTISAQVFPSATASASLRGRDGHYELEVARMPAPPRGRIYQVWLQRPGGNPQPTNALFTVTQDGSATVAVPGSLSGVERVLVTDEPLGGSRFPTRRPAIVAQLM